MAKKYTADSVEATSFTGSLFGTSSYSVRATSASYATYALNGGTPLYSHSQTSSSNLWSITHSLGTAQPLVIVYDSNYSVIIPQSIVSTSTSSLSISFPTNETGYASIAGGSYLLIQSIENQIYTTWEYLVNNWSVEPVLNATITGGEVYTYILRGTTHYRFIPTTYDPTQDAFYSNFDGTNLTNLITTRG